MCFVVQLFDENGVAIVKIHPVCLLCVSAFGLFMFLQSPGLTLPRRNCFYLNIYVPTYNTVLRSVYMIFDLVIFNKSRVATSYYTCQLMYFLNLKYTMLLLDFKFKDVCQDWHCCFKLLMRLICISQRHGIKLNACELPKIRDNAYVSSLNMEE